MVGITGLIKYIGTTIALCTKHAKKSVHSVVNNHTHDGTIDAYSKKHANRERSESEKGIICKANDYKELINNAP